MIVIVVIVISCILNGYVVVYDPSNPRANSRGGVYEHVLVAEQKLGRYLKPEEVVHHSDRNRSNNNPDNLWVFASDSDHAAFHSGNAYYTDDDGIYRSDCKVYACAICGRPIDSTAIYCVKCWNVKNRKVIRPSREELKDLIRNKSFLELSRMFGVSDNAIRKWCKTEKLPHQKRVINNISNENWVNI